MAFKMRGTPMQRNFGIGDSALPKKTKTLGTRTDYTEQEDKEVNTLTKTSERTGKSKTRDISQRRADRIRSRQARKAVKKQAKQDVRNSGKNETDQQQEDRINRDFPADFGTEGYTGPSLIELQERHKITDKATPGKGKKKNQPTTQEIADYKKEHDLP